MKATEVVNKIKEHYYFKNDKEVEEFFDISTLSNWKSRDTYNVKTNLQKVHRNKCRWLITERVKCF